LTVLLAREDILTRLTVQSDSAQRAAAVADALAPGAAALGKAW
jgi:hypothetical protein